MENLVTWQYQSEKKWFFFFMLLSILIPVLALVFPAPPGEPHDIWFQRSGALIVLCAVAAEYNLIKVNNFLSPDASPITSLANLEERFQKVASRYNKGAATAAIIGTVIWGYGDWFYRVLSGT